MSSANVQEKLSKGPICKPVGKPYTSLRHELVSLQRTSDTCSGGMNKDEKGNEYREAIIPVRRAWRTLEKSMNS